MEIDVLKKSENNKQETLFDIDNIDLDFEGMSTRESTKMLAHRNPEPKFKVRWDFGDGEDVKVVKKSSRILFVS